MFPLASMNCCKGRRKFRSQTSDNMDSWKKQRWEESERRRKEVRRSEKRKREKKEDAGARKGRKVAIHKAFFQWFVALEGPKVTSLQRRVPSQLEKIARFVARSTFPSQKCEKMTSLDHFWKMRCWKKCTPLWREAHFQVKSVKNVTGLYHFWKMRCWKKFTPLWREAHFQVKSVKAWLVRTIFDRWDAEKSSRHCGAKAHVPSQKCKNVTGSDHFWKMRCWKSACGCGAKRCTKHTNVGPLLAAEMSKKVLVVVARSTFSKSKVSKHWGFLSLFRRSDVEKVHTN